LSKSLTESANNKDRQNRLVRQARPSGLMHSTLHLSKKMAQAGVQMPVWLNNSFQEVLYEGSTNTLSTPLTSHMSPILILYHTDISSTLIARAASSFDSDCARHQRPNLLFRTLYTRQSATVRSV